MFDLATLDTKTRSDQGVDMPIIHPGSKQPLRDDEGQPITIRLLGRTADRYRQQTRDIQEQRARRAAGGVKTTLEDIERENIDTLTACTVGWQGLSLDGQVFPYTVDNARRLWSDGRFIWLRDQAMNFIAEDGNFLANTPPA